MSTDLTPPLDPDWESEHFPDDTHVKAAEDPQEWADRIPDSDERAQIIALVMSPIVAEQREMHRAAFIAYLERMGWG